MVRMCTAGRSEWRLRRTARCWCRTMERTWCIGCPWPGEMEAKLCVPRKSGARGRLSAKGTNPSFGSFLDDLNPGKTGVGEQLPMLVRTQEHQACSRGIFFGQLGNSGDRAFIDFRNDDEVAAGLGDAEHFAHVARQIRPPEVSFHGSDEIEHAVRKGQLRDRAVADLDPAESDPACIRSLGGSDALLGIIDAVDFSLRGYRRQFADGPAAATTDVEDGVIVTDGDVPQAPVGEPGMARIHSPKIEATQPSGGLAALIHRHSPAGHSRSPPPTV